MEKSHLGKLWRIYKETGYLYYQMLSVQGSSRLSFSALFNDMRSLKVNTKAVVVFCTSLNYRERETLP